MTHGMLGSLAMAVAALRLMERAGDDRKDDMHVPTVTAADIAERRRRIQTSSLSEEEQAERDRPKSRQERRQIERLARKGRVAQKEPEV